MKSRTILTGTFVSVLMLAAACGLSASLAGASESIKADFVGKIDAVQVTPYGARFISNSQGLSLYTHQNKYRQVLLEGINRKQDIAIKYEKMACPSGIAGTCGIIHTVYYTGEALNRTAN